MVVRSDSDGIAIATVRSIASMTYGAGRAKRLCRLPALFVFGGLGRGELLYPLFRFALGEGHEVGLAVLCVGHVALVARKHGELRFIVEHIKVLQIYLQLVGCALFGFFEEYRKAVIF